MNLIKYSMRDFLMLLRDIDNENIKNQVKTFFFYSKKKSYQRLFLFLLKYTGCQKKETSCSSLIYNISEFLSAPDPLNFRCNEIVAKNMRN
ncbi:hypothetical protein BpHYR1_016486 [Brachionus plicatilis]|uniref:Uncharacterized protein n=1 Tax=Brachionus plicatilis TaxID=10195 RepID=A0A3M7T4L0_BRAPC|nr:hypothetical protein BpHYR1_016486 [Brachionus plicatilis]